MKLDATIDEQGRMIGFFPDMPFDEYLKVPALSGSELIKMRRSPAVYLCNKENPKSPTEAMILGTVLHTAILEPSLLGKLGVWKKENGRRFGKAWDEFEKKWSGTNTLTDAEYNDIASTVAAVRQFPPAHKYLSMDGPCELSMFWVDSATGRYMKGRIDKLATSCHTIVDLKKTRDCAAWHFGGQAYSLNYHIKMAMYWSGYRHLTGHEPKLKFIAVETVPPYECAVYRITQDVLAQGLLDWQECLSRLSECEQTGNWPPVQEVETDLTLPPRAFTSEDELADLEYAPGE